MQGTMQLGRVVRLLLGAGFLCLAWVVLSTGEARAAERPLPVSSLVAPVVPEAVSGAERSRQSGAAITPAAQQTVTTASVPGERSVERLATPLASKVSAATQSVVAQGAATVTATAGIVPVAQKPVARVTATLVRVADTLPVVGTRPLVDVPLPTVDPPALPHPVAPLPHPVTEPRSDAGERVQPALVAQVPPASTRLDAEHGAPQSLTAAAWCAAHARTGSTSAAPDLPFPTQPGSDPWSPHLPGSAVMPAPSAVGGTGSAGGGPLGGDPATLPRAPQLSGLAASGLAGEDHRWQDGLSCDPGSRPG